MPERLVFWPELETRVNYSRWHVTRLERDGKFPRRRKVTPGLAGRVAWLESELDEWMRGLPQVELAPAPEPAEASPESADPAAAEDTGPVDVARPAATRRRRRRLAPEPAEVEP